MEDLIKAALESLDHTDNTVWTTDGLPIVEVISAAIGEVVTREQITDADPHFKRVIPEVASTSEPIVEEPVQEVVDIEVDDHLTPSKIEQWAKTVSETEINDAIAMLDERTVEANQLLDKTQNHLQELKMARKTLNNHLSSLVDHGTQQSAIRDYLASELTQRMEKAKRREAVLAQIDVSDLDPRSALDNALAQKNRRGKKRPA